jgi:hypothetical protein
MRRIWTKLPGSGCDFAILSKLRSTTLIYATLSTLFFQDRLPIENRKIASLTTFFVSPQSREEPIILQEPNRDIMIIILEIKEGPLI